MLEKFLSTTIRTFFSFCRLLEDTLNFMTKTAQHGEHAPHDATGKFWKALLHKTYEIVDKVSKSCKLSVWCFVINPPLSPSARMTPCGSPKFPVPLPLSGSSNHHPLVIKLFSFHPEFAHYLPVIVIDVRTTGATHILASKEMKISLMVFNQIHSHGCLLLLTHNLMKYLLGFT